MSVTLAATTAPAVFDADGALPRVPGARHWRQRVDEPSGGRTRSESFLVADGVFPNACRSPTIDFVPHQEVTAVRGLAEHGAPMGLRGDPFISRSAARRQVTTLSPR